MRHRAPRKIRPYQRQALRDREDRRSEKGVEKPIATIKQQIARGHRIPPAERRLDDPIDCGEPGGQDPGGRNEHPWLKTLRHSHSAKVLQAEPGGKSHEYASTIDDRSRQYTRRSRIHRCRGAYPGVELGYQSLTDGGYDDDSANFHFLALVFHSWRRSSGGRQACLYAGHQLS